MLRSVQQLEKLVIGATDGPIGKVKDFYFDDEAWVVRYVTVDTNRWLGGREVLISPYLIARSGWTDDTLPVTVAKEQVRNSPSIDSDKPISRQYEKGYLGYYGYPYYWGGTGIWGAESYPFPPAVGFGYDAYRGGDGYLRVPTHRDIDGDPHLRSCQAVKGYHILARDGEIGHVQGFLVDDSTWSIRYLIVDTSNWWMGQRILLSPDWIHRVSWMDATVTVDLDRQILRDAPAYDAEKPLGRREEDALFAHYSRRRYWNEPPARAVA